MENVMRYLLNKRTVIAIIAFFIATSVVLLAQSNTLVAPDGSTVIIHRDNYGVPHIIGETETGIFFGQGFAVAEDRLWQMEITRRAAEGKLAEWFGFFMMDSDKDARRMYYTQQERVQQFANLSSELQTALTAYTAGINTYLDSIAANPLRYKPYEFTIAGREMESWTVYKSVALFQFMSRGFGQRGGQELTRLLELQNNGWNWFDANRPINDPNAPTTIPGNGVALLSEWHYSGMSVRPELVKAFEEENARIKATRESLGIPTGFGSFAVQIAPVKSSSNNVMLLGCPQMGDPVQNEPNVIHEVELHCPTLHVGGMQVAGLPLITIGHNENTAMTMTSGNTDNSDVYIDSTFDDSYSSYYYEGQWLIFDKYIDTIDVLGENPVVFTHYRTIHGPVFLDDLFNHQVYSMKMTFWDEEMNMVQSLYEMIKANNLAEFEIALITNPMSFNMFYIGKDQNIKFWHVGKYQNREDGVDPRLPHKGDGSEEWGGFIPFENLPMASNPTQSYFVNWNNKPVSWWNNGDNCPWYGNTQRVNMIDNYVSPISSFTYDNLKSVPFEILDHGSYQQAIEMSTIEIIDENIVPPGQSGFIDINNVPSPHFSDQWPLHVNWQFKDQLFAFPVGIQPDNEIVPERTALHQNYPNPFNPTSKIKYSVPVAEFVTLIVYDVLGSEVATLVNEEKPAGSYDVEFDATVLSSGIYFYRLRAGDFIQAKKMVLMK
jgi:penicillin amidase